MQDLVAASAPRPRTGLKLICGILAVLLLLAVVVYVKRNAISAHVILSNMEKQLASLRLPPEEYAAAIRPFQIYASLIREGRVSPKQSKAVFDALNAGETPVIFSLLAFEASFVRVPSFTSEEQAEAHKEITRFAEGARTKRIDPVLLATLFEALAEKHEGEEGSPPLSELPKEKVTAFIASLKAEADNVKLPDQVYKLDLAAEIKKAVETGLGIQGEATPKHEAKTGATGDRGTTNGTN